MGTTRAIGPSEVGERDASDLAKDHANRPPKMGTCRLSETCFHGGNCAYSSPAREPRNHATQPRQEGFGRIARAATHEGGMSRKSQMLVVAIVLAMASGMVCSNNGFQASPLVLSTLGVSVFLFVCAYFWND